MSKILIMTGQMSSIGSKGCFFAVFERIDLHPSQKERYEVALRSPFSGEVVVEPAGPEGPGLLTEQEVFGWLATHKDW